MPMPPHVQMRLIKESLVGKTGTERIRILRTHLAELPGYFSGPYGKIRAWLLEEIDRSRSRARAVHQETFMIPKEGHRQVALVGAPNAGKSALLHALTGLQLKVADYPYATLKPTAGLAWIGGAALQLVEVPGILPGAADDRGHGRALLGAVRTADFVVLIASLREPIDALLDVLTEMECADVRRPCVMCLTGCDDPAGAGRVGEFREAYPDWPTAVCSSSTGEGLDQVRELLWSAAGLIRVWPRGGGGDRGGGERAAAGPGDGREGPRRRDAKPFVLDGGADVRDLAATIHKDFPARLRGARIWGPSARFPAQTVGAAHRLADGDEVELLLRP